MSDEIALKLATAENAFLIAPAGYGKTELIARAVALQDQGKTLLLTHTHAGVRSMRERLNRLGVSSTKYRVETIASWALKLAVSYPKLSGIVNDQPAGDEWKEVYQFAQNALQNQNIKTIVKKSYDGIYVDEYQDCTKSQHGLVITLADLLPVKILGDPLQGIFGFDDDPLIDWDTDIFPNFKNIGQLKEPWRWKETNPELGNWLETVRNCLLTGQEFDLREAPNGSVTWKQYDQNAGRNACFHASSFDGSIVAIQKWPNQAHALASQLRGLYTSMEEIECRDLLAWAQKLDRVGARERCLILIDGAGKCWTRLKSELNSIRKGFEEDKVPRSLKYPEIVDALKSIKQNPDDLSFLLPAFVKCEKAGDVLFRKELWYEMKRVLEIFPQGNFKSFEDVAWHIRNQARKQGRKIDRRLVSRTLLVKGLEFDHVIVVNADDLDDPKNLYVALTRCKQSLTILSRSPIIKRSLPENHHTLDR